MIAQCILTFLALGLTRASPITSGISCSNVKPVSQLNITQLRGDWIILTAMRYTNGVPIDVPTPQANISSSDICFYFHIDANSTETSISGKMGGSPILQNRSIASFNIGVDNQEKGLWLDLDTPGDRLLVISAVPDKHLVGVGCMERVTKSEGSDVTEHHVMVTIIVRYDPQSGSPALDDQDLTVLLQQSTQLLGVPTYVPIRFRDKCFDTL